MKVLLAGETWVSTTTHYKGFNYFSATTIGEGYTPIMNALAKEGIECDHIPAHLVQSTFPTTLEELNKYDVVMLSDLGSDSLLLSDEVFITSRRTVNRLVLLKQYVAAGGSLMMVGGYLSFTGFAGSAHFKGTEIEQILPVDMLCYDDRAERPEGVVPVVANTAHPVFKGIDGEWPFFLGYNRLVQKAEGEVIATVNGDPFIAVRQYEKGRTLAFSSDMSPHWGSPEFVGWKYYSTLLANMVRWLAGK